MKAGKLRHRITLQNRTITPSGYGDNTVTYTDIATVWAAVMPLRGREYWSAQQIKATTTHEVEIRHRSDVGPEDRVAFGSRYFTIDSVVNPEERGIKTVLLCSEVL